MDGPSHERGLGSFMPPAPSSTYDLVLRGHPQPGAEFGPLDKSRADLNVETALAAAHNVPCGQRRALRDDARRALVARRRL